MSLTQSEVGTFVFGNLELPVAIGNGWNARCPFCKDSKKNKWKKRFWLKYESPESCFFHCFNCEAKGTFYDLYAHLKGTTPKEAYEHFRRFDPEKIRKRFTRPDDAPTEAPTKPQESIEGILDDCVKTPEGFKQIQLLKALGEFQEKRKVTDYQMYVAHKGKFSSRFIIPVIEAGKVVYFQGRAIFDSMDPKYLNPVAEKSKIILNREHFSRDKYIIITEGLIDAMSVEDHQGTSCLGASLRDEFLSEVTKYTDCGVIVALDNDPTGMKRLEVFMENSRLVTDVLYFLMPKVYKEIKDLNQLKTETDTQSIYDFVLKNSFDHFQARIRMKLAKIGA